MLRTIDRYIIRETIPPFLLSLLIFTFLLEIPPIMRDLEQLVAKGVSWAAAGQILLTLIPQALGLTIPMALLTGLLIALGRLSVDREAVRKETAKPKPGRPKAYVFSYKAPTKAFKLQLRFTKSRVDRDEVIEALQAIIRELRSGE